MRRVLCCLAFCLNGISLLANPSFLCGQQNSPAAVQPKTPANPSNGKIESKLDQPSLLQEAQRFYRMGKFDEAVDRYKTIIASGSQKASAYAGLSRAYLRLKRPNDAYRAAAKAIADDPLVATAHSALAEVYFRQGKLQQAHTEFMAALKTTPTDARSYLGIGLLYKATYNFKKAKLALDKAHNLDPNDPDIRDEWIETRPLFEQEKALEGDSAPQNGYFSRAEKAAFKQRLAVVRDKIEHPERTCEVENGRETATMKLMPIGPKNELISLEVYVNGIRARLVLSTVSSGMVINGEIAKSAKVQPITPFDLDALGDQNPPEAYVGFARSLKIGNVKFRNCYVTVVERTSPGSFYDQYEGLIAAGFFSPYLVNLDFPHGKLSLTSLPTRRASENTERATKNLRESDIKRFDDRYVPRRMASWTKMYHFGSAILIPARVNNTPPELFEVSASSALNVLAPDIARDHASLSPVKRPTPLEGINGIISGVSTGLVKLEFSGLHFDSIRVISFDETRTRRTAETTVSGYLGYPILRNLHTAIDYRDGLIHFDYDQDAGRGTEVLQPMP